MIILHFDLPPQFTYELFHIYTSSHRVLLLRTLSVDLTIVLYYTVIRLYGFHLSVEK